MPLWNKTRGSMGFNWRGEFWSNNTPSYRVVAKLLFQNTRESAHGSPQRPQTEQFTTMPALPRTMPARARPKCANGPVAVQPQPDALAWPWLDQLRQQWDNRLLAPMFYCVSAVAVTNMNKVRQRKRKRAPSVAPPRGQGHHHCRVLPYSLLAGLAQRVVKPVRAISPSRLPVGHGPPGLRSHQGQCGILPPCRRHAARASSLLWHASFTRVMEIFNPVVQLRESESCGTNILSHLACVCALSAVLRLEFQRQAVGWFAVVQ